MQARRLIQGDLPLLVSIPHAGMFLPPDIKARLTEDARALPDTDFYVDKLYAFAEGMGASILTATYSRYVIDLNRDAEDTNLYPGQVKTGLCPLETFAGKEIYQEGEAPDAIEKINRIAAYWLPYHEALQAELARIKQKHGYAVLYDAHSIMSQVPRLFDGVLPDLNIGTAQGASCHPALAAAAMGAISGYEKVLNGRFVGGYITRHYGHPAANIHALQMELACKNYMDEVPPFKYRATRAEKLQGVLVRVLEDVLHAAATLYG